MKKLILVLLLIGAGGYAAASYLPIRGDAVDNVLSDLISKELKRTVRVRGASIERLRAIRFEALELIASDKKPLVLSGPGNITSNYVLFASDHWLFDVQGIHLTPDFEQKIRFLPEMIRKELSTKEAITRIKGIIVPDASGFSLQITEMLFIGGRLKGTFFLKDRKLSSAQGLLWIDKELSQRVLKNVYLKMVNHQDGFLRFRISFRRNLLTIHGPNGPLFQASWGLSP